MGFDEETKRIKLLTTNPGGVTVERVIENCGLVDHPQRGGAERTAEEEERRILREEVNPEWYYI